MAVRSNVLINAATIAAGAAATYTAPSGVRTIVKYIVVRFSGADLVSVDVTPSGSTLRQLVNKTGSGANTSLELTMGLVLAPGDKLSITNRGANAMQIHASGSELVL
jgi:hypothetical protein